MEGNAPGQAFGNALQGHDVGRARKEVPSGFPAPVDFAGRPLSEVSLFAHPITFMPPGQVHRQAVHMANKFLAEGNPTRFDVLVRYDSIRNEHFNETTVHDLVYLKQATYEDRRDRLTRHRFQFYCM